MILIVRWVATDPGVHDATDRGMIIALLFFLGACVVSEFPRQSLDAALQATALVAGFHFARRTLGGAARAGIESAAAWLCIGLSILTCVAWGRSWADWLALSGGAAPPFSLPLLTGPFGNRHDIALLMVLLSPALWSPAFRARRAFAVLGTILVVGVVLLDSSRNVELAILAASAVVVTGNRLRLSATTRRIAATIAVLGATAATALVLLSPAVLSRVANVAKVMVRFSLWNDAGTVWIAHPVAGIGPGGFPFGYMMSDHFRLSLFDPRHPDNAVVQLLVEAGVIGLVAATICVLTLIRGAHGRYRAEPRATWAILVFALATIGANPTDFVFLLVPAMVWAAILVPTGPTDSAPHRADRQAYRPGRLRALQTCSLAIVALAIALTSAAGISYEVGRDAYLRGDDARAESALGIAEALDPGLAIYARERASIAFAVGDLSRAVAGYRRSLHVSPLDPVAWRGLSLALLASSDVQGASDAAEHAVRLMSLSPENQLVRAATAKSDPLGFDRAIRVVLQRQPWIATISWDDTVLAFVDRTQAVGNAVDPPGSGGADNPYLGEEVLAIIADRPDISIEMANDSGSSQVNSAAAAAALAECDVERSLRLLASAGKSELESGGFWIVSPLVEAASHRSELERQRSTSLSLRFWGLSAGPGGATTSALAGNISDVWRYRRNSLGVNAPGAMLPSGRAGLWTLLTNPARAVTQLGGQWPPGCDPNCE